MQKPPKSKVVLSALIFTIIGFTAICVVNIQSSKSETNHESPFPCGANPEKIWDVHLEFTTKGGQSNSVLLKVPEPYLNELSRSSKPLSSAIIYATYDGLKPKCIVKNGVYTRMTGKDFLNLYLHAKPYGSLEVIRKNIQRTEEKWTKIETEDGLFNHFISRGKKPLDHIFIPKDTSSPNYFIRCSGAHNHPKPYHTCSVRFDYRKKLDVEAGFDADRLSEVKQAILKATALIDRFETTNASNGEK